MTDAERRSYEKPTIEDWGDLVDMTRGEIGSGNPDAVFPQDPQFPDESSAIGP